MAAGGADTRIYSHLTASTP